MIRHPDPCASSGETSCALRAVERAAACALNEAERILTGALDGCCDIHQALQATDLKREMLAIADRLGAVEAATQISMARAHRMQSEAA